MFFWILMKGFQGRFISWFNWPKK